MKKTFILLSALSLIIAGAYSYAAQLTSATVQTYEVDTYQNTLPLDVVKVWKGSAVGTTNISTGAGAGYVRPLKASDTFKGFAESTVDNSAGSAGDLSVQVRHKGIILLSVANVGITNEGYAVFARDGATFVLDREVTNSRIGTIHRFVSSGVAMVKFDASGARTLTQSTNLTDSSGGTNTSSTIYAITTALAGTNVPAKADVQDAISALAYKINELEQRLK